MKVYTYFASVPELEEYDAIVKMWRESWSRHGWTPVVLTPKDVKVDPQWLAAIDRLPTVNPREYERACFVRWLAMAQAGGGVMADIDVMNYGWMPQDLPMLNQVASKQGYIPSVVYGSSEAYQKAADFFPTFDANGMVECSDMDVLEKATHLFRDVGGVAMFGEPGHEKAPLVHYSFHSIYSSPGKNKAEKLQLLHQSRVRSQKKTEEKLLLALQCWRGDQETALELTRLICDMEPERRDDVEFMIAARKGCDWKGLREIEAVAREKFKVVHVFESWGYATGWPCGCNELWIETMQHANTLKVTEKSKATGILTFEADCIPLAPDWIDQLIAAWNYRTYGKRVLGSLCKEPALHINGNALFEVGLHRDHPKLLDQREDQGWDYTHRKLLVGLGENTPLIAQKYNAPTVTLKEIKAYQEDGAVLLHGVKHGAGIQLIRGLL